ncbi:hypothetical protein PIB30_055963 [Stylosanthes scabra]|uniref:ADP-ribosyl cyclase/cyclic ADP-ribose hydrolase n=1 Tax=Stylosanthes scabra TaxID=79078 RepID=A0ABU6SJ42_9FABA|nr:hypothetical protein [Stylosanthes scabra]
MASLLWFLFFFFVLLLLLLLSSLLRPSSSSSSSSSTDAPIIKYDVFISFRGGDIRDSFLSHLKKEMLSKQIDFFVDDKNVHPGDQISPTLVQAIGESFISLVIFSEHYASSKWCMEELVKITECMKQYKRIVMPVFYHVEPYQVRHQKGTFAEAFDDHKRKYKVKEAKLQKWRSVLKEIANISGIHYPSPKYEKEAELIEEIIKSVNEKLPSSISSNESKGLVGIDEQVKSIELLLAKMEPNEVGILGIWGMGGIGKTTIAQVIFTKYSSQYQGCCFLKNVREQSQTQRGLDDLCVQLVSQLLAMKSSRVIVTTRDEQILIAAGVHHIYKVQELSFQSSLELFCLKAFHKSYPENGYQELSDMAIWYAKGLPLALKVLGSFLCSRSAVAWESALRKLETHPDSSIFNVLKLSYDGLDDSEKNIFLDIAFFFKGEYKDNVIRFLDSCDFFGAIGIDNLQRKALITISPEDTIEMHDLIEQMGLEIVFKESTKDVKKRSRLRNPDDVRNLLENSKGENSVEGIMCDLSQIGDLCLNAHTFRNMPHLRFLKLYAPWDEKAPNVYVPKTLKLFCAKLRYLEWNRYPLNSLPSRFCTEKLVELRMPNSQISKLWEGTQDLPNLTSIDLDGCKQLVELPDLSKATKLQTISLRDCEKLCQLHPSILSLQTLEYLDLSYCKEMKSVKGNLKSLKSLRADKCSSLEEFSMSTEELQSLCLPLSRIKSLQKEFCCFISIEHLSFRDCRELIELPHNMKFLSRLWILEVSGCCGLRSIPELPPSLQELLADDCTSLERVFSLKAVFSLNRRWISFVNCMRLEEESVNDIMEDAHLTIFRNVFLSPAERDFHQFGNVFYPGKKVPEWFRFRTEEEASVTIEVEQCNNQLLGFVFCCVVSQNFDALGHVFIRCEYRHLGDYIKYTCVREWLLFHSKSRLNSDHVLIWTHPDCNSDVLSDIERCRDSDGSDDHDCTCNQNISFRFRVNRPKKWVRVEESEEEKEEEEDCFIKGCGVIPVYASTVLDAIQNIELKFNLNPLHNSIPLWMDLDTLKSDMIRKSRGKSKPWW